MKEQDLILALEKSDEFKRIFKFNWQLCEAAQQFPHHAKALISMVLEHPDEFHRLIQSSHELLATALQFPQHTEALINRALTTGNYNFLHIAKKLPRHAEPLINFVLSNPEEVKRLISDKYDLIDAIKTLSSYRDSLISILENPGEFKRLIKCSYDLIDLIRALPLHADSLINILEKTGEFRRLIKDNWELNYVAKELRPLRSNPLINMVLKNPDEFQRLIRSDWDLVSTARALPQQAKALIHFVFTSPVEVKRLIDDKDKLFWIAKKFPQYGEILLNFVSTNPDEVHRLWEGQVEQKQVVMELQTEIKESLVKQQEISERELMGIVKSGDNNNLFFSPIRLAAKNNTKVFNDDMARIYQLAKEQGHQCVATYDLMDTIRNIILNDEELRVKYFDFSFENIVRAVMRLAKKEPSEQVSLSLKF